MMTSDCSSFFTTGAVFCLNLREKKAQLRYTGESEYAGGSRNAASFLHSASISPRGSSSSAA